MSDKKFRIEKDSMGEMQVPADALWGASTQRAVENFPVSGIRFSRPFIRSLGMVKLACVETNMALGKLPKEIGDPIARACTEVMEGELDDHFVLDIFQTGSGTSTNMNANEVIANRANELMGISRGDKGKVHPNDHVNMGQSSNDVIPTCINVAALEQSEKLLIPALKHMHSVLEKKAAEFDDIVKIGRTHLQDATPVRLGQQFGGYASMISHAIRRLENARTFASELAIGGTAVGTGLNTPPEFAPGVVERLSAKTGIKFREAENHFEAQSARDSNVELSGVMKTIAVGLVKIANDMRWLGSGPRCGIGELLIPPVQPGSSIMPGKVNPVMAEAVLQVCAQIFGNDASIAFGGQSGVFELNVMMPVIAHNLLESITLAANVTRLFADRCLIGIQADRERCESLVEQSLAMVTALNPKIGYDRAAQVAKRAYQEGRTVREVCVEMNVLPADELEEALNAEKMTDNRK